MTLFHRVHDVCIHNGTRGARCIYIYQLLITQLRIIKD